MKKLFILIIFFIFGLQISAYGNNYTENKYVGRWVEKISERVVMDIFSNQKDSEYMIFITWRENNLAQKDIYRLRGTIDKNGNLNYKNGIHIYRFFSDKNLFEDKIDYTNDFGTISINNDILVWTGDKDKTKLEFIRARGDILKDSTIKNRLFSITLPEELRGSYEVKTKKDKIEIYHKMSKKTGFGGFVFGVKAYKTPTEHAILPGSRKVGELVDKAGILYDIVLKYPTDVQYDYTKSSKAPESFQLLYDVGGVVNINGINGSEYFKNQGMRGEDLYKNILEKHIIAINEKWDSTKLEKENMSYMYNVLRRTNKNIFDKIGYTYYDINADGIDEILIGEIADGNLKGVIYDIYTMVDRKPKHVISGGLRDRYYVCDNTFLCNEYSSGASENGIRVYNLVENSTELFPQVSFKYDEYTNQKNPYFISYSDNNWKNVTKEEFMRRKKVFEKYERFNFIPFSDIIKK